MIKGIGTHIKVADFEASRKFYEALGFEKSFEMGPKIPFKKDATGNLISVPEDYQAIDFVYGGCKLEIADGHRAVKPEVFKEKVTSSKISLMIPVDSLEDIIDRCKQWNRVGCWTKTLLLGDTGISGQRSRWRGFSFYSAL